MAGLELDLGVGGAAVVEWVDYLPVFLDFKHLLLVDFREIKRGIADIFVLAQKHFDDGLLLLLRHEDFSA